MAFARTHSSSARPGGFSGARGGAPAPFWLLILLLGSAWIRVATPYGIIYPGQGLLIPALGWALWRGPLARPHGRWERPPLLPLVLFGLWVALLCLLRGQWSILAALAAVAVALAVWAYAAYRLGLGGAPLGTFIPATILLLAAMLLAGGCAWLAQADWPGICVAFNCDPATPLPFAFRGGWISATQYLIALIFLLPPVGGTFLSSWREGAGGGQHWLLTAIVLLAGLGVLAGMRWWGFGILGLGLVLTAQALASDAHPADGLLLRGILFFLVFGAITLYGLVPGYGTALVFQPGSARVLGIRHSLPSPVILSSEHEVTVAVQAVNAGTVALSGSPERPMRVKAMVLFTPRSGGESRMAAAGEAGIPRNLAPGETVDLAVPVQVPPWISQGYLSWAAEDDSGRPVGMAESVHQGFRFVNADFSNLGETGDNTLSALAARARAAAAPGLALPAGGTRRSLIEPVLGDAFDTIFFSPVWGQTGPPHPSGQVFDPARPLLLQVLHQYGLVGLGLVGWFFASLFRRAVSLGFGRRAGSSLVWRLVPVSVILLAAVALVSGDMGRFHSWWGCVLLGGFVQGVHERTFPARGSSGPPRWLERPLRAVGATLRGVMGLFTGIGRMIGWLVRRRTPGTRYRPAQRRPQQRSTLRGSRR